eukprot:3425159-Amphidinium_carterae.2
MASRTGLLNLSRGIVLESSSSVSMMTLSSLNTTAAPLCVYGTEAGSRRTFGDSTATTFSKRQGTN